MFTSLSKSIDITTTYIRSYILRYANINMVMKRYFTAIGFLLPSPVISVCSTDKPHLSLDGGAIGDVMLARRSWNTCSGVLASLMDICVMH